MEVAGDSAVLWIGLGAIAGACCRHYLSGWIASMLRAAPVPFPYGTLVVNLAGAFIIGMAVLVLASGSSPGLSLGLVTGFLGAFTTFSTYTLESYNLWNLGNRKASVAYWVGSPILGLLAVGLGMVVAHALIRTG